MSHDNHRTPFSYLPWRLSRLIAGGEVTSGGAVLASDPLT